jgi:aspartate ammonia-lyase
VGLEADEERCRALVEGSVGVITAAVPFLGYERAGQVAAEALRTGRHVREILLSSGDMTEAQLEDVLSIRGMTSPRALR